MDTFKQDFYDAFIYKDRWKFIADGLKATMKVTLFALLLGLVLGALLGIIRTTHDKTGKLKISNFIAKTYLTVIRGTPVIIQLMIIYFVVFADTPDIDKVFAASLGFGLNSAAYVAEIFRSGIMSIDKGQFEAGESLGLNYPKTMIYIIMPQAVKNVRPALGNEGIVLLKETSVAGCIGLMDLNRGGEKIISLTYKSTLPLLAVALVYLVVVLIMTFLVSRLERRLAKSDRS